MSDLVGFAHGSEHVIDSGPNVEMLFLSGGLLVLAVVFFIQKNVETYVPIVLALVSIALALSAFFLFSG